LGRAGAIRDTSIVPISVNMGQFFAPLVIRVS
jgi:hypothetical protein